MNEQDYRLQFTLLTNAMERGEFQTARDLRRSLLRYEFTCPENLVGKVRAMVIPEPDRKKIGWTS
jgi:hypothetical protein